MSRSNPINFIFYGNYFYGLCAVALAVEAGLQQQVPLNHWLFYTILFLVTVVYYTIPYREEKKGLIVTGRSMWYQRNAKLVTHTQVVLSILAIICMGAYTFLFGGGIFHMSIAEWAILLVFPILGVFYYGFDNKSNLRKLGLLKPFIIGFIWAGLVTTYPLIFSRIEHNINTPFQWIYFWLFVKNTMYVGVLCIMFDIKDYVDDYNQKLNTIIVKAGLRNTIFYVLLPLITLGLVSFIYWGISHQFPLGKIILNTIPFVLLIWVAYSLRVRRSLLYYLVVVDGLMLLKGICGTLAMLYF
jgi:hypothetical protein